MIRDCADRLRTQVGVQACMFLWTATRCQSEHTTVFDTEWPDSQELLLPSLMPWFFWLLSFCPALNSGPSSPWRAYYCPLTLVEGSKCPLQQVPVHQTSGTASAFGCFGETDCFSDILDRASSKCIALSLDTASNTDVHRHRIVVFSNTAGWDVLVDVSLIHIGAWESHQCIRCLLECPGLKDDLKVKLCKSFSQFR